MIPGVDNWGWLGGWAVGRRTGEGGGVEEIGCAAQTTSTREEMTWGPWGGRGRLFERATRGVGGQAVCLGGGVVGQVPIWTVNGV